MSEKKQDINKEPSKLRRIALSLSYNGSDYFGWQAQKSGLSTIQKHLEIAISKVAAEPIEVVCAGRTDKSVHASHQIVHFDTSAIRSERAWVFGCNTHLPRDISVTWAGEVDDNFHARFSAVNRRYHYVIYNHPIRPANFSSELTWCHQPLDAFRMHEAAQCLVGEHDFTSFRAVGCQSKSPFRNLEFVRVNRYSDLIVVDIKGNAFLHHMVRNIAGVLIEIGAKKQAVSWCKDVLLAKDRTKAAVTAPPNGLYLSHVCYPESFNIPASTGAPSLVQAMINAATNISVSREDMWDIAYIK